jgi:hypothetical protein
MHVYLLTSQLGWNDLFDYLLTWTSSQIGQKIGQNGQWRLVNCNISQVGYKQMTLLVKMANGVLVK